MEDIQAYSYTLLDDNGHWLGQIVLINDGFFGSVADWGNISFAWRHYGEDFKKFLCNINNDYFATKMAIGMAYIAHSKSVDRACEVFARKILSKLQEALKKELNKDMDDESIKKIL